MAKMCVVHPKVAATAQCAHCHKDLCKSCLMVTPNGTFCSSECSILNREMKALSGPGKPKKSGGGLVAVFVLLLLVAGVFLIHLFAPGTAPDLLGRYVLKTPPPSGR